MRARGKLIAALVALLLALAAPAQALGPGRALDRQERAFWRDECRRIRETPRQGDDVGAVWPCSLLFENWLA